LLANDDIPQTMVIVNKTTIKIKKNQLKKRNKDISALLQKSTGENGMAELIIRIY